MDSFGILAYFLWCEFKFLLYCFADEKVLAVLGGGFRNADEVAALYKEIMSAGD